VNKHFITLT